MSASSTGMARCKHCGAELRLFTIMNRDMQGLCTAWKKRHEKSCSNKSPLQRNRWAQKYIGKDRYESSITVDLAHPGFIESEGH